MCTKFEKNKLLCIWKISGIFYFSSWNMGPTLYLIGLYIFVQCRYNAFRKYSHFFTYSTFCCVIYSLNWKLIKLRFCVTDFFIFPSTRCTCVMIMLFNQLLDMPHLAGGWIILAKVKCSLTDVNPFLRNIFVRIWKCLGSFI